MIFCSKGSSSEVITDEDLSNILKEFYEANIKNQRKILFIPPDFTRFHSQAGKITQILYNEIKRSSVPKEIKILPALGTHAPMTESQIKTMFGPELASQSQSLFKVHDWRNDVVTIGKVPASMVQTATKQMLKDKPWPAQLNKLVWNESHDVILSIGQVVPHEVMGMANYNKNLFVGVGGVQAINLSHFIGAVYGMENMMGRASNPLRDILNYASEKFLGKLSNLWYILTVMAKDAEGKLIMRGLFIGNDIQCYLDACELSLQVNFTLMEKPLENVVVYLNPQEFHSTWLGNKAIYRTRMAMANKGRLLIIAPGVKCFGEDKAIDDLIRQYGYHGTDKILDYMKQNEQLQDNLGAVAHMIHGSSEGRFHITYAPGFLSQDEIQKVGFEYANLTDMMNKYQVDNLKDGWNTLQDSGEVFYYISNPALGLWAVPSRFQDNQ